MKKRSSVLILALLLVVSMFCALAVMTGASAPTPEISIPYCNLSFRDSICIKYAVKSNVDDVKILIWTSPEKEYTVGTEDYQITKYYEEDINGVKHKIFDYTELAAKQMADVVYARAYSKSGGADYYSEVNKYSVLQYAYNMLGKTGTASDDAELKELLTNMLAYGASAQKYLDDYKTDRLATADWYQVKLTAGVLDDGCTHGLYLPGDKVTMTAPETDASGAAFSYWKDGKGNKVSSDIEFELTVGNKNEIYTPVYVKYSVGLDIEEDSRAGVAYVLGMGDCTDTEIVIPAVSENGYPITEIDRYAFENNTAITSISLPNTVTVIGRYAFDGCTSLTDVYYDGTEEEWNEKVEVESGNDAIENAAKHFNAPVVETFTVTFVDYDGTVLKTETVEKGKSATAPEPTTREGFTFAGWDKAFDNISSDITIVAQYEEIYNSPTFVVSSATAKAGDTVTVVINVKNNPGILAMTLALTYDESALELTSASSGEALSMLTMTSSKTLNSGCKFAWDGVEISEDDIADGEILVLTFTVLDNATSGSYDIVISYNEGDIYDNDINSISFKIENGTITVN